MIASSDRFGWAAVPLSSHFRREVPGLPGIYAVLEVSRTLGLPVGHLVLYVGRSLALRRRLDDHLSLSRAHNGQVAGFRGRAAGQGVYRRVTSPRR